MRFDRPVVAYCRVLTLEQKRREYGIDIQVRDVMAFAERQGLLVQRFYKGEAQTGIEEDRKAPRRLVRDCRPGRVRSIVLPSLDTDCHAMSESPKLSSTSSRSSASRS